MPMNGDRSIPADILLDRVLIDAFGRKFPGIRPFGLVETSIEAVVVDLNARGFITHDGQRASEAARFANVYDGLDTRRSASRDRRCCEVELPDTKKGFILAVRPAGTPTAARITSTIATFRNIATSGYL